MNRKIRQGCLSPILFNVYSKYLNKETLKMFGDFKVLGQVTHIVKYAGGLVLLAKVEEVLQCAIDRLVETGRFCGLEVNAEKTKVMRISRQPSPIQIMIHQN
jgi:hypothetical protein